MTSRTAPSRARDGAGLAGFMALCFGTAALGAMAAASGLPAWYSALEKPAWTPPGFVFGPVWTVLYACMATAGWLAWRESRARTGSLLFLVQLALNLAWPWLFFRERRLDLSFAAVALLWLALAGTLVAFWRTRPLAGLLLVPYLAWVSFAAVLCARIWAMN